VAKSRIVWLLIVTGCVSVICLRVLYKKGLSMASPSLDHGGIPETVFYVSTQGNDAWSGTLAQPSALRTDGPFATIEKARNAIRKLKSRRPLSRPVTVYVRGGVYELRAPIIFSPEDSGTEKCPITYAAYPHEVPVLSGGRAIAGWKRAPNIGHGELWEAEVPGVKQGEWYFHEIFVDGQRRQRARAPRKGFFYVDGNMTQGSPAEFRFHAGDIRSKWAGQPDVDLVVLQAWTVMRAHIMAVDKARRTVALSIGQVASGKETNARYWVENAFDALDSPGEWYLDRRSGVLYYWPEPGEDMTRVQVVAPVLDKLVGFQGGLWSDGRSASFSFLAKPVHNIQLRGFTLSFTDWSVPAGGYTDMQGAFDVPAALEAAAASACTIKKCVFQHLGQFAVEFGKACRNNRIIDNEMTDLGAGGVKVGEPQDPNSDDESTAGNVVANNRIHNLGIIDPGADGVWVGESSDNSILHNEIYATYYTGISAGWTWGYGASAAHHNIIEFNLIHDIGRGMMADMGCIYTLGVQPGTVIRNNVCHDVTRHGHSYGAWGIYLDEGSSQIVVENNLVYRTEDGGFHQNYGQHNFIRNNIFALARNAQIIRSRNEKGVSFTFERNIVFWKRGTLLGGKWNDGNFRFDHDLYFYAGHQSNPKVEFGRWSTAQWQSLGYDKHSLIADPLFVNPEKGDFLFQPGSPAMKIGFKPINVSQVGLKRAK